MSSPDINVLDDPAVQEWIAELLQVSDFSLVEESIELILDSADGYLEATEARQGLVAMELLAAALSRPSSSFSEHKELIRWLARVRQMPTTGLIRQAIRAHRRIQAEGSELRENWEDSGDLDIWLEQMQDLFERLVP